MGGSSDEFPLLKSQGLYAADVRGDGNCLFNALSDQIYGTQIKHHEIRARVIDYMRAHSAHYKQFIEVLPGGATRRNPKRKNAGAYSTPVSLPSEQEITRVFEEHLARMARGGVYGDNMEIMAFCSAYGYDVKIYLQEYAYMIHDLQDDTGETRDIAHIAYHTWEHYSSIRNLDGPHTGLPKVSETVRSPEEVKKQEANPTKSSWVQPWMVDDVKRSLCFPADSKTITKALEECKGNVNNAVSKLFELEERGSVSSSAHESSSVERDPDSDDEAIYGPNKKRERRLSRARKNHTDEKDGRRIHDLTSRLTSPGGSQDSLDSVESQAKVHNRPIKPLKARGRRIVVDDSEDDEDWKPDSSAESESPKAASMSQTTSAINGKPRLKINPPKPPSDHVDPESTPLTAVKTRPKELGAQRKVTARDRKDIKKQAQKAAAKERKQAHSGAEHKKDIPIHLKKGGANTPELSSGIRTLYI